MAYIDTRYSSKEVANRLVLEAVIPKFDMKVDQLVNLLLEVINPIVDGFFRDLASHMGSMQDLATQIPGIPGLRPWNPLTVGYIKDKGNALFWAYSNNVTPKVYAARMKIKTSRSKSFLAGLASYRGDALIPKLQVLKGNNVFGGTEIRIKRQGETEVRIGAVPPRRKKIVYTDVSALTTTLNIRLWSKLNRTVIPHIETWLADEAGVIDEEEAAKLIGKSYYHRPLVRPFMAYYSVIVIPRAIEAALRGRFPLLHSIQVLPP